MFLAVVLFIVGLVMLIYGGDWFVDGAAGLARRLRVNELLIGATIVSIGTTLPEVMVSATGALQGSPEIAYGNAVGSVICNTALISAITIAFRPGRVDAKRFRLPVIFFFVAAAFYVLTAYIKGSFSRLSGIILLAGFGAYIALSIMDAKKNAEPEEAGDDAGQEMPLWKQLLYLIAGAALIAVGSRLLVNNGRKIAEAFGVPERVIAVTFIALGTSLPELVTAVTSLIKGHSALSLGNVVGANLFNIVLVSGFAITIKPFDLPSELNSLGVNTTAVVDVPLMLLVMAFMTLPALIKGELKRYQGIALLCVYALYVAWQFAF